MSTSPEATSDRTGEPDPPDDEVGRLKAERDSLAAELAAVKNRRHRGGVLRRGVAVALVALFALLLPLAVTTAWVHRTVLDTDTYVSTVAPLGADPTVTASLSRQITDQVYAALDPQTRIADALPPRAAFLAAPVAGGVRDFIQDRVTKRLNSPQFAAFWVQANRTAHTALVNVLDGKSKVILTNQGQVVLNLVPLLNAVLQEVQATASDLVGKNVKLPQLTGDELPSVACEKISAALNRPLPATCGQIPLFPEDRLVNARRAVRAFDGLTIALLVVVPLLAIGALAISRRRRRTLIQLLIGGVLTLVVARRALMWFQAQLIATADPENTASRTVVVKQLLHGFFDLTVWILAVGLVVLVLALVTGPYRWSRGLRSGVGRTTVGVGHAVAAGVSGARTAAESDATARWIRAHVDPLRVGAAVVVALLCLLVNVSFIGFLVLAAILAAIEIWLTRLRTVVDGPEPTTADESASVPSQSRQSPESRPPAGEPLPSEEKAESGSH